MSKGTLLCIVLLVCMAGPGHARSRRNASVEFEGIYRFRGLRASAKTAVPVICA